MTGRSSSATGRRITSSTLMDDKPMSDGGHQGPVVKALGSHNGHY